MRTLLVAIATLLAATSLAPSPALAGHPPIVLESYVEDRPADAEKILAPLLDELAKKKFVIGADVVGRQFEAIASRPAITGGLPKNFVAAVGRGYDLWTNGRFDEAVAVLEPLVEAARENTGEFAKNQNRQLHPELQRALIALALSQLKLGDRSSAKQTVGEALRGDPSLKLTRGMYGQEASELYQEVLEELKKPGPGKLIVAVKAEGAGIYVNERLLEIGGVELYLFPGEYRVVARVGNEISRAHRVVVRGGDIQKLTIDPAFDRAVHTGPGWTGLRYPSGTARGDHELRHGAAFATAIDAEQVIVVGIDEVRGRRMIKGALVNKMGEREFRSGSIPLDASPSGEQRRNLARFLVGGQITPDIVGFVRSGGAGRGEGGGDGGGGGLGDGDGDGDGDGGASRRWGGWKWITGGAALAAGVAGGVAFAYHGECAVDVANPAQCPSHYDNAVQGWLAIGGAAALAGVTVYLAVTERGGGGDGGRGGAARRTAYVAPTAGGAIAGYAARF